MNRLSPWLLVAVAGGLMASLTGCEERYQPPGDQIGVYADPEDPHFAYYVMLTDEWTKVQPQWDGTTLLPKSLQELSKVVFDSLVPSKSQPQTGWTINCIQFKKVPARGLAGETFPPPARKNRWYCEFTLFAPNNGNYKWWQNSITRYVFLDGTIIQPQRAKAPPNAEWLRND